MNKEPDRPGIAHLMKIGIAAALTTGWISIGNLWMFGGLPAAMKKAKEK